MKIGLVDAVIVLSGVLWMALEAYAAYRGGWFFPWQVSSRWMKAGISFSTHGGMYGDVLLPFLFAWVITTYGDKWDPKLIVIMALIGVLVTLGNHLLLIFTQIIPDPLGWKEEKWSTLIALHLVYMSVAIAIAGLFYFSPNVSIKAAVWVSIALGVHVALGTHVFLGVINRFARWVSCPDFLSNSGLPWMQLGIWYVLAGLSWKAAGWQAASWVAGIGTGFVTLLFAFIRFGPPAIRPYGG